MPRTKEGIRARWSTRFDPRASLRQSTDERAAVQYAAARKHPLSSAARLAVSLDDDPPIGPYETRYDVLRGYGMERTIIRP